MPSTVYSMLYSVQHAVQWSGGTGETGDFHPGVALFLTTACITSCTLYNVLKSVYCKIERGRRIFVPGLPYDLLPTTSYTPCLLFSRFSPHL